MMTSANGNNNFKHHLNYGSIPRAGKRRTRKIGGYVLWFRSKYGYEPSLTQVLSAERAGFKEMTA